MTLDPQARTLLDAMAALGDPPFEEMTPVQFREARAKRARPAGDEVFAVSAVDAGGVPARLYRPNDAPNQPLLVFFHGGGWVGGDLDSHDGTCRSLCNASGCSVLSVDYRLAPEHPYPAPLDDAVTATAWAHANAASLGCDPDRVAVGGDSAGANLAAVVANMAVAPLQFQLLVYPVTDAHCDSPTFIENGDGYFLTAKGMRWFAAHYLSGGGSPDDPRVSPLFEADDVLAATPPAFVITAGFDPLRHEGEAYAQRLMRAGVRTTLTCYPGMFHGFFSLGMFLDEGQRAIAEAGRALATELAT
jgi:acetyl esterase